MKKIRIILTIMICINIIITILLLIIQSSRNTNIDYRIMSPTGVAQYESQELGFTNSKELVSCIKNTNFKASKLMQYAQVYVQESLPKIYNELIISRNVDLNKYFTENKEFLSNVFKINTVDELGRFKKKLEDTRLNFNNYSKANFVENSGISDKRNFSIKIKVFYENDSEINLAMKSNIDYDVKFEILEEE